MVEKVLWSGSPSKKFIVYYTFLYFNKNSMRSIGSIGLTFFIIYWFFSLIYFLIDPSIRQSAGWSGLITTGVFLFFFDGLLLVYNIFLRKSFNYLITDSSVSFEGGLFKKFSRIVPLSRVSGVFVSQNFFQKLLGIYDLEFQVVGDDYPLVFYSLDDPFTPKDLLEKII